MSVYPKVYSKSLSPDENRSFSYLVTNENAVIVCGVTTTGKIITLERLGAAYCLKLYCLTTNSLKWERIIQQDMKVFQYANINIFIINDEKHAFELIDRDESLKLYEKIRGCIKKLSASSAANPSNETTRELPQPRENAVRPPATYISSIKGRLKSNVLTIPSAAVKNLIAASDKTNNVNPIKPTEKIRYPEEISRVDLPNISHAFNSGNSNSTRSPVAQNRTLSINLDPTIENTRIPVPYPRRKFQIGSPNSPITKSPNSPITKSPNSPITKSPILGESTYLSQEVGIPIVSPSSGIPKTAFIQNFVSPENNNRSVSSSAAANGNAAVVSPGINRKERNIIPNEYESESTISIVPLVLNGISTSRNNQTSPTTRTTSVSTSNHTSSTTTTTVGSSNLPNYHQMHPGNNIAPSNISSSAAASGRNFNINTQTNISTCTTNVTSSLPMSISSPNLPNHLVNNNHVNSTNNVTRSRGIIPESDLIQGPNRRVKIANSENRTKTRNAFIQPPSMVTDVFENVRARLFGKAEEKATPKCVVIGNPTDVTHQIHLDSLDFRNMQLHNNQLKGLIKSKSIEEHNPSLDTNVTVFNLDEEGPSCAICLTDPPTHVIVPCGHKILCEACVGQDVLSKLRRKCCMMCNGVIKEIIKVYE